MLVACWGGAESRVRQQQVPCPLMALGTLAFLVIVPSKRMGPKKVMKMVKV